MKKTLVLLVMLFIPLLAAHASAADITVNISVPDKGTIVTPETARFNIFDENGEWLANSACDIFQDTRYCSVVFPIPDNITSNKFSIVPTKGITDIDYNGIKYYVNDTIPIDVSASRTLDMTATALYLPPTGTRTNTLTFSFDIMQRGTPLSSTARFNLFDKDGNWLANEALKISKAGVQQTITYTLPYYFYTGEKFYLCPTVGLSDVSFNGTTYSIGQMIEIQTFSYNLDDGSVFDVNKFYFNLTPLYKLPTLETPGTFGTNAVNFVNSSGVSSRTNYLIWISKKDFKVTVFIGSAGNWQYVKSFDCSIGAPGSPTITGQFEYYQYQSRWLYDTYYVGPVMRFAKGGYAIHSTLLRYNGTNADGRLRMRISHGCVRVAPANINWLVDYMPINTRVYITE